MKTEKEAAVSRKTDEAKTNIVASVEFAVRASLRGEYSDADFVHMEAILTTVAPALGCTKSTPHSLRQLPAICR